MITDWLERRRLVRKGLACDKTRLSHHEDSLQSRADSSWIVRLAVLGFFIALLHVGVAWGHPGDNREDQILAFIIFISGLMLLELDCPEVWCSNSRLVLILGAIWLNLVMVKGLYLAWFAHDTANMAQFYFLSPCTFAAFLITLLLGTRVGLFSVVQVSMLASLLIDRNFIFLLVSLLSGFTAVYFSQNVRKRFDLIKAGLAVGCLNLLCAIVLGLVHGRSWESLGTEAIFGIGGGLITAFVVSAILPVVEWISQITTTISWLELADLNHPLLQQMTMEAPGTYHHSLIVANLAEAGAKAIGIDATACRVMAYFHDVGKIIKPEYFTENIPPGANPHENLTPSMSALIIVAHVKEGTDLALKYGLKKQVLDAIQQHHGDSVVTYFHQRALQQQQDAREGGKIMNMREEDVPEVSENSFRYPGPKPQTKEIGLLSVADAPLGTSNGLTYLLALTDSNNNGETILQYLQGQSPSAIYVTGHSLGGALAPPMLAYLNDWLNAGATISNMAWWTFAGPTSGDQSFVNYFESLFTSPFPGRYHNTLDIAPYCWWSETNVQNAYAANGLNWGFPEDEGIEDLFEDASAITYTQPEGDVALPGTFYQGDWEDGWLPDWSYVAQAAYQHSTTTYAALVDAMYSTTKATTVPKPSKPRRDATSSPAGGTRKDVALPGPRNS